MKEKFYFHIDVFGTCNLKCPSCPTGNYEAPINPKGAMHPDLLRKIIDKAVSECEVVGVGLFNWNEPVLHPKLPELIRIVKSRKLTCAISSNLNHFPNMDAVLEANPDALRISNSGFTQDVYERTHRGGDIERVKQNMVTLAEAKKRTGATTHIHVLYHRYKTNLEDEQRMRRFAEDLGFGFKPVWAFMMPLEKTLAYVTDDFSHVQLSNDDRSLIDSLALPLKPAAELAMKHRASPCILRDNQMTLDCKGNVQLCCAVFESSQFTMGSFLDVPLAQLQAAKNRHPMCGPCMKNGLHVYATYGTDEFDGLAAQTVGKEAEKMLGLRRERLRKAVEAPLRRVGRKLYRVVMGREAP